MYRSVRGTVKLTDLGPHSVCRRCDSEKKDEDGRSCIQSVYDYQNRRHRTFRAHRRCIHFLLSTKLLLIEELKQNLARLETTTLVLFDLVVKKSSITHPVHLVFQMQLQGIECQHITQSVNRYVHLSTSYNTERVNDGSPRFPKDLCGATVKIVVCGIR